MKINYKLICALCATSIATLLSAQKKPLDHTVYDSWESVTQLMITNDGRYEVHVVSPQEGDTVTYVTNLKTKDQVRIDRAKNPQITFDSRYVVFQIKPSMAERKAAKKAKKKADEQPKDSIGWLRLGTKDVEKRGDAKSFKMPEKGSSFFAYTAPMPKDTAKGKKDEKHDYMIIHFFADGAEDTIPFVSSYSVSKYGNYLSYITKPSEKDSTAVPGIFMYDLATRHGTMLMEGKGDYKTPTFDEKGGQFVFFATTDTTKRDPKVYNLYYGKTAEAKTRLVADTLSQYMPENWAVNSFNSAYFSEDCNKLYFGISPIVAPKDTTIDESEHAKLDIWNYQDDYLQPMQLKQATSERNRSYLCVFDIDDMNRFTQLGSKELENVSPSGRGNNENAVASTTNGYRIESQWTGFPRNDIYVISTKTGDKTLVAKAVDYRASISTTGNYLVWFDRNTAHWYLYDIAAKQTRCLTEGLDVSFQDLRGETPDKPISFGSMGWSKDDKFFYIYDMYDIWQFDPTGKISPKMITDGFGRTNKITFRNIRLDNEHDFIDISKPLLLSAFNNETKENGYYSLNIAKQKPALQKRMIEKYTYGLLKKAKNADVFVYTKSNFNTTPDVWTTSDMWKKEIQLSHINPQMKDYLWGTAELVTWVSKDNIETKGILYKPENFDPNKKYPMMIYFYEKHSDELYRHFVPAPSRSIINIPFYVSRGYLVFTPDIHYTDGHPGRSAYNSIVAGAEMLCKNPWVDSKHIGIQGQSWGGYQVAYLVTQTDMFAAAGAGAPVSNMTSAYGGIRWGSGVTRQMQYERQQSRIGKTLWDGFDLYIENSPLFFADKVKTPLLIMHNDNDGAVPWYQGIEYFTALKRLGKVVYMLQYNGEEHNLVQRRNTRDLSVRLQQFFDHYLKGEPMPVWMKSGVPATEKGRDWGLEIEK